MVRAEIKVCEKWLTRPFAVLPASELLSSVYKKCLQISNASAGDEDVHA